MGTGFWIGGILAVGAVSLILINGEHEPKAQAHTGAGYVAPTPNPVPVPEPCNDCNPATMTDMQTALVARGYNVGPKGADGIYGHDTWAAWNRCYKDGMCAHPAPAYVVTAPAPTEIPIIGVNATTPYTGYQPPMQAGYEAPAPAYVPTDTTWARTCPNGDCFGATSAVTGNERNIYVREHTDKNGVHYGASYRSHSRR